MRLTFCGASHEVTGSCYLLETATKKILIDCGMFQGSNFNEGKNFDKFPFDPAEVDAVLVTHAHLDHVGRIPKLAREGFGGKIFMTKGTQELTKLVWDDALEIMMYDHRKFNTPMLYDATDVDAAAAFCSGVNYNETVDLGGGVTATFKDAGHIFGASFIEVAADGKRLGFSGDIGNVNVPILKDTEDLSSLDVLLCESTYGDRVHETSATRGSMIADIIKEGYRRGGTIMVPAFSIERTQELLYELHKLRERGEVPVFPVFVDSPLAIDATKVFKRYPEYYDTEAAREVMMGDDFLNFPQLQMTYTREESKMINTVRGPKMVIAGAGMMNGGRILHHAIRYLSDLNSMLVIVGYQAEGTLGRRLYEGADMVQIFGERIAVRCSVKAIGALSAHGDQNKLLDWVGTSIPKKVYCIHGETHAATELAHRIRDRYQIEALVPVFGETVDIV